MCDGAGIFWQQTAEQIGRKQYVNAKAHAAALRELITEAVDALKATQDGYEMTKRLDYLQALASAELSALRLSALETPPLGPINPSSGRGYFTVAPEGWGAGWTAGEVTRASDTIFPDISELDRAAGELKLSEVFGERPTVTDPEWIEWCGGECPVRDGVDVEIRHRDGDVFRDDDPHGWRWKHIGSRGDIVAYRIWP